MMRPLLRLEGLHRITITVTDSDGLSTNTSIDIEILPLEIEEIPDEKDESKLNISLVLLTIFVLTSLFIVGAFFVMRRGKTIPYPYEE